MLASVGDHASFRDAPVHDYGVGLAHAFTENTSLVVLCSSVDERIAVHRAARSLHVSSMGFTSDHLRARSDLVFWRCPDCHAWSDADNWYCGGGGTEETAQEACLAGVAMCPVCNEYMDRYEEDDDCACAKGKAKCEEHISSSRCHNAVLVCKDKLPVKLGRQRRQRRNAHIRDDKKCGLSNALI